LDEKAIHGSLQAEVFMKRIRSFVFLVLLVAALTLFATGNTASAVSLYGQLGNFDVFNDTAQDCHGFEIELDGISGADVIYAFGDPYTQYGNPVKVDFPGGVYVRYQSSYDNTSQKFIKKTPVPPGGIIPTAGHACWTMGPGVPGYPYPTAGCEHFGVSTLRSPTNVIYRWLVEDPASPGTLKRFGTNVSIPAPVYTVVPPPPPPPNQPPLPPVVQVVLPAPPPDPEAPEPPTPQWGVPVWVKVFKHELPKQANLNNLVIGDPDVPDPNDPQEIEVEWKLMQTPPPNADPMGRDKEEKQEQAVADSESVVRRYDFYKYIGAVNLEDGEALCDDQKACPEAVGDYIGSQNAAVNLIPVNQIQAQVTTTGFVYSRVIRKYVGTIKVKNIDAQDVNGPIAMVFADLPAGVSLVNPTGLFMGNPYLVIPSLEDDTKMLAVNQTVSFPVQFSGNSVITFTPTVYTWGLP
jgi:hypothetical protein